MRVRKERNDIAFYLVWMTIGFDLSPTVVHSFFILALRAVFSMRDNIIDNTFNNTRTNYYNETHGM